ncbi:hypothetical protein PsorP6_018250 [Peronosclerospora sorghi]|uniref:Uncharacterized protein n=1 Tax=Peronosclerospora sorghi TaxID=230839 RepID=A0ACC0WCR3_9STRA|nr:hypothetical protein PsorP6_018250 [Peronosclerospora sorghi]
MTQKQGQKLLAALNLPQVGAITLLEADHVDGPGLFTIELNERVYTIKARSHDEAAFWVDALLWRQAGGVIAQKSPDVSTHQVDNTLSSVPTTEEPDRTAASTSTRSSTHMDTTSNPHANVSDATTDQLGTTGAPCAACCSVQ